MVFADVLCGSEEVVVASLVEPVADCRPKATFGEGGDEAQLRAAWEQVSTWIGTLALSRIGRVRLSSSCPVGRIR